MSEMQPSTLAKQIAADVKHIISETMPTMTVGGPNPRAVSEVARAIIASRSNQPTVWYEDTPVTEGG